MKERPRLLVVDDEPNIRRILQVAFDKAGLFTATASSAEEALGMLDTDRYDCVLTDVTMPGMSGYDLQRRLASSLPDLPVVIMTAFGTIPQAIQAIRDGAYEYVTKPFDLEAVKRVVMSAIESDGRPQTNGKPRTRSKPVRPFIAESPAMRELLEMIDRAADSRATVLITGESGTGKEVVARLLHERSSRCGGPFVAISCAALPETLLESELFGYEKGAFTGAQNAKIGRFEAAHGGTLFLDEVGDIPPGVQIKLLRVLQEREFERLGSNKPRKVDVRLVTATNRDLSSAVEAGTFRLDLLYRLQVVELRLPALRDRQGDVLALAEHFLRRFGNENGKELAHIAPEANEVLQAYHWPGNVRELENVIERATVLARPQQRDLNLELLPLHLISAASQTQANFSGAKVD